MNPWICVALITSAGACGGVINALVTEKGFKSPSFMNGVWCPGFLGNVLVGAFSAFASWAFYGSGASIDVAQLTERTQISLRFSALAGALLVGVAGARWITSEADKQLQKETTMVVAKKGIPEEVCERILKNTPRESLKAAMEF